MGTVVHINLFKKRKLAKAEAEWLELMTRAAEFEAQGKRKLAEQMVAKAKAVRVVIDSLRKDTAKPEVRAHTPFLTSTRPETVEFRYDVTYTDAPSTPVKPPPST